MQPLPYLRRERRIDIIGFASRFSPGIARVNAQIEPFATAWDGANHVARGEDGPLWVNLGDSSSQGIGATSWSRAWPHLVMERLRAATADPWRLVNLSMSGARFADVSSQQLPVLQSKLASPQLVTCIVGGNDLMWRIGREATLADARKCVDLLPRRTLLSRLGGNSQRCKAVNSVLETRSSGRELSLFEIWKWPSAIGALSPDRIHPNDVGYRYMADLAWSAISTHLGLAT